MCGIAGIVSKNPTEVSLDRLQKMTDSIIHRGPDGFGHWIAEGGRVGLGHRRLSILDLRESAGQPMHYLERYTIVFNGEIYNYVELKEQLLSQGYGFRTTSDTEVLMALYHRDGVNCLQHLDGMFAFAIYDNESKTLFCARDRFGEKPFHYAIKNGEWLVFGSEIKEIWAAGVPKLVDDQMLYNYLAFNYLAPPNDLTKTFYANIFKLEPATYMLVDTQSMSIEKKKYWEINLAVKSEWSFEQSKKHFADLFYTSISRRLRSDVPVGSSLSGGLDSSAVVCAIDALNADKAIQQKTFSARFPGYEKDESYFQQLVIDKTHAQAFFTYPDADSMLNQLDEVFFHQEEPFGSASMIAQYEVFKLAKEHNVTVLLDGQGADEILAGYHSYYQNFFHEIRKDSALYEREWKHYAELQSGNTINQVYRPDLRHKVRSALPGVYSLIKKSKNLVSLNKGDFTKDFYSSQRLKAFDFTSPASTLNDVLKMSTTQGPLQQLLKYADRNSMAHSREVRLPFLSHELVEFLFSLPATYKIQDGWTKFLMRKSLEDLMPKEIMWRKDKIGYEPPQKKWLEQPRVQELIMESRRTLVGKGILNKEVLNKPINPGTALGGGDNSWQVWMAAKMYA